MNPVTTPSLSQTPIDIRKYISGAVRAVHLGGAPAASPHSSSERNGAFSLPIERITGRPIAEDTRRLLDAKSVVITGGGTPGFHLGVRTLKVTVTDLDMASQMGLYALFDTDPNSTTKGNAFVTELLQNGGDHTFPRMAPISIITDSEERVQAKKKILGFNSSTHIRRSTSWVEAPPVIYLGYRLGPAGTGKRPDKVLDAYESYRPDLESYSEKLTYALMERRPSLAVEFISVSTEILHRAVLHNLKSQFRPDGVFRTVTVPAPGYGQEFAAPLWRYWQEAAHDSKILTIIRDNSSDENLREGDYLRIARPLNCIFTDRIPKSVAGYDPSNIHNYLDRYVQVLASLVKIPVTRRQETVSAEKRYKLGRWIVYSGQEKPRETKSNYEWNLESANNAFLHAAVEILSQANNGKDSDKKCVMFIWSPQGDKAIGTLVRTIRTQLTDFPVYAVLPSNVDYSPIDAWTGYLHGYVMLLQSSPLVPRPVAKMFGLDGEVEKIPEEKLDEADRRWPYMRLAVERLSHLVKTDPFELFRW